MQFVQPKEHVVKPLKYKSLPGLSEEQLRQHHAVLYAGYVKKVNEIRAALTTADRDNPNATFSQLRELKVEESFALNGVKLHEGYFENMGGPGGKPTGKIAELITRDFGSIEAWEKDFRAMGMCARGWVVLAYDIDAQRLFNYLADTHNQGGVWNAIAIFIMDVFEHAYFLDYGTARKDYIETFMKNIDWNDVNAKVQHYGVK